MTHRLVPLRLAVCGVLVLSVPKFVGATALAPSLERVAACVEVDGVRFCHGLRLIEVNYVQPPSAETGVNWEFAGRRSCTFDGRSWQYDFDVRMFGVDAALEGDYPALVDALLVDLLFGLTRPVWEGRAMESVDLSVNPQISVDELREVFGIAGTLFPSGRLGTGVYTSVNDALETCVALARDNRG